MSYNFYPVTTDFADFDFAAYDDFEDDAFPHDDEDMNEDIEWAIDREADFSRN